MKVKLVKNAGKIFWRSAAVRFALLAAVMSAVETAWSVYTTGQPRIIVILTLAVSLSSAVARVVHQASMDEFRPDGDPKSQDDGGLNA